MSDNTNFGFGRFVPGFDFLQNIAKGTAGQAAPQMPSLSNWIAPTLNVEELDKRISELKAVHFWLDQNSKALGATIQALELQKMTLATLKGMNFSMGELANALTVKTADTGSGGMEKVAAAAGGAADAAATAATAAKAAKAARAKTGGGGKAKATGNGNGSAPAGSSPVDPLQWWGALTQQFQEIASNAMKDVTPKTAMDAARNMATGVAKQATKSATGAVKAPARKKTARKTNAT